HVRRVLPRAEAGRRPAHPGLRPPALARRPRSRALLPRPRGSLDGPPQLRRQGGADPDALLLGHTGELRASRDDPGRDRRQWVRSRQGQELVRAAERVRRPEALSSPTPPFPRRTNARGNDAAGITEAGTRALSVPGPSPTDFLAHGGCVASRRSSVRGP